MVLSRTARADSSAGDRGRRLEAPPRFLPTPERISQFLEMNMREVATAMQSVKGRQMLYQKLMEHEQDLRKIDPSFHPEHLRQSLELVGEVLQQKDRYLKDVQSPEKKGMFRRAWEKMKGFAKNHPVVTTLLVLALIAGGTALTLYLTGNLEIVASKLGLGRIFGGVEGAGDLMAPAPATPPVPGGGELAIPPPVNPLPEIGRPI